MNMRQRREFESGLLLEIDAWLAGQPSRRTFIRKFGELTGMLAASVSPLLKSGASAQENLVRADPTTPLGKALPAVPLLLYRSLWPDAADYLRSSI